MSKQEQNLSRLKQCVAEAGGDVREGVRRFAGKTITQLAWDIGVGRKCIDMMLGRSYGRTYRGVRRSTEEHLGIPQYSLDSILGGE